MSAMCLRGGRGRIPLTIWKTEVNGRLRSSLGGGGVAEVNGGLRNALAADGEWQESATVRGTAVSKQAPSPAGVYRPDP